MKKLLVFISVIVVFYSCKNETQKENISGANSITTSERVDKLSQLNWLLGSWQNISEDGISKEIWSKVNDSLYTAKSFTIVENDTVFSETVQLFQDYQDVYFSATDALQNGGKAVAFKLIPDEDGLFVFENNLHDFPKRIIYTNPVKDSIHAWIVGIQEGQMRKVDFYFERVK
jgi:hypothetical protein